MMKDISALFDGIDRGFDWCYLHNLKHNRFSIETYNGGFGGWAIPEGDVLEKNCIRCSLSSSNFTRFNETGDGIGQAFGINPYHPRHRSDPAPDILRFQCRPYPKPEDFIDREFTHPRHGRFCSPQIPLDLLELPLSID
jgi:hypothetical protein